MSTTKGEALFIVKIVFAGQEVQSHPSSPPPLSTGCQIQEPGESCNHYDDEVDIIGETETPMQVNVY